MTLPHEIEVGEVVGLRHWKLITGGTTDLNFKVPMEPCVAYAKTQNELKEIITREHKIVRETKLASGLIGEGIIWPTNERVEAKCIKDMPRFSLPLNARFPQFEDAWCARRGYGPAPCTMDRPFVCNDGYNSSQCGVYAWNTRGVRERKIAQDIYATVAAPTDYIIWGLVALSGRVVEHEEGYRAEFARPIALLSPNYNGPWQSWMKEHRYVELLDLYKVERYSDMEALLLDLLLYEEQRDKGKGINSCQ